MVGTVLQRDHERALRLLARQSRELDKLRNLADGTTLQRSLELLNSSDSGTGDTAATSPKSNKTEGRPGKRVKQGPTPQPELAVVTKVYKADQADLVCPCCGEALAPLKDQFESSEMIDVVEVEYRCVTVQRQKYVCGCGGAVETAPGPQRAIPGGRYSLGFGGEGVGR